MTDRTCAELFDHTHATIIGDADRPILGVAYRSDQVSPGDAFCCIVGLKADGHAFAQDAVDRGATVLVVERMLEVKGDNDVTFILVNDTRKAMAHLAAHFYRMPTQDLSLVGITGTNGKTTTAHLVEHTHRVDLLPRQVQGPDGQEHLLPHGLGEVLRLEEAPRHDRYGRDRYRRQSVACRSHHPGIVRLATYLR